jgi:hypothetical protein
MMADKKFSWDAKSALRKAQAAISVSISAGPVTISKQITEPHNPKTDAYRSCSNCGKHINYHKNGKCP